MIWGKTEEQKQKERNRYLAKNKQWHKWFAWYPVKLDNGQSVWLQVVERSRERSLCSYEGGYAWFSEYKLIS